MNEEGNTRGTRRCVALDIHKHYCVIAAVDREGRMVLPGVRGEHADLEGWQKRKLRSTDHVVIESTTNAWHVYDLLSPLVERVVANPIQVKQIAKARVKTDVQDTFILARLLAANLVPEVWVLRPPCAPAAPVVVPAQAAGGNAYPDREPDAQRGPSPSLAA